MHAPRAQLRRRLHCVFPVGMVATLLAIVALFASVALLISGNALLGTLVALRVELEGFGALGAGLVLAVYSAGFVAGTLLIEPVVRRVGHIRAFAAFAALASVCALTFPLFVSVWGWVVLRVVLGFSLAGLTLVAESWVNGRATLENRGRLLATYMVVFFLAASAGQFLVAAGDPGDFPLFSIAAILLAAAVVPLALTRALAPELHPVPRIRLGALARSAPLGVAGAIAAGTVASAFGAAGPIFALRTGLEIGQVALFLGIPVLATMALQWPLGMLSDRLPRARVLLGAALAALVASLLVPVLAALSLVALIAAVSVFMALANSLYPMSLALTHDRLDASQVLSANATLLLAVGIGTVIGPLVGPAAMALLGPPGLFLFTAVVLALLLAAGFALRLRREVPVAAQQPSAVSAPPAATPLICELDPRLEPAVFEQRHGGEAGAPEAAQQG